MAGENPFEKALFAQIEERRQADPLIGAKLGGKEVAQRLLAALKNEKGVHIESLLCMLGALAGYSCQAAVRAQARAASVDETSWLTVVQTKDGKRYFFGDRLNYLLLEAKHSVWSIAAGGAQQAGGTDLPNIAEMVQYNASVLGSDAFGRPRLPEGHACGDLPANYARDLWPKLQPLVVKYCPDPAHWPVLFALAAQEIILMGKAVLAPGLALRIVMESALPVSHMDFGFERDAKAPPRAESSPAAATATRPRSRSKNWIGYALALIVIGAFQIPRFISSPTKEPVRPVPMVTPEAFEAAVESAEDTESEAEAEAVADADSEESEAEYIPDDELKADVADVAPPAAPLPAAPPAPAAGDAGIKQLLREGKLRVATAADYQRWKQFAASHGIQNRGDDDHAQALLQLSQMYLVKGPLTFPADLHGAHAVAFIVMPGVPHPHGDPGHSIVMSMNR